MGRTDGRRPHLAHVLVLVSLLYLGARLAHVVGLLELQVGEGVAAVAAAAEGRRLACHVPRGAGRGDESCGKSGGPWGSERRAVGKREGGSGEARGRGLPR